MRLLERHRERQAKRVALIHSMQANGEAPTDGIGIAGSAVVVVLIGGAIELVVRLLGG